MTRRASLYYITPGRSSIKRPLGKRRPKITPFVSTCVPDSLVLNRSRYTRHRTRQANAIGCPDLIPGEAAAPGPAFRASVLRLRFVPGSPALSLASKKREQAPVHQSGGRPRRGALDEQNTRLSVPVYETLLWGRHSDLRADFDRSRFWSGFPPNFIRRPSSSIRHPHRLSFQWLPEWLAMNGAASPPCFAFVA
jgi:hypothetical protein